MKKIPSSAAVRADKYRKGSQRGLPVDTNILSSKALVPSTSRSILIAVLISFLFHLVLLVWLSWIHIGKLVIPAERQRTFRSFEIHQAEIPPMALNPENERAPDKVAANNPPEPPKQLPEPKKITDPSLLANPPRPLLPDLSQGSASSIAPKIIAPPVNLGPYAPNDQAKITAEVSKFAVEPDFSSISVTDASLPANTAPLINMGADTPGVNGRGNTGVSTVPSLDQIEAQFRLTSATIDPNLPAPVIVRLPSDILFDFDSSQLRPGADSSLQLSVDYIKKFSRADIEVDGHTDTIGDDDYNLKLSAARALVVMNWLQLRITDPVYTWHANGFGKTRPLVNPHGSKEEQEKNRRVEIVIRAVKSQ